MWVLAQNQFVTAEIEAEYVWGLAHPTLFNGEGGYYLTTLTSAGKILCHEHLLALEVVHKLRLILCSECFEGAVWQYSEHTFSTAKYDTLTN